MVVKSLFFGPFTRFPGSPLMPRQRHPNRRQVAPNPRNNRVHFDPLQTVAQNPQQPQMHSDAAQKFDLTQLNIHSKLV